MKQPWSVALLAAATIAGQTNSREPAPNKTLQVSAEEVLLDLVVHDKRGKPVTDLQPGDLQISDGGSLVKLNALRSISAGEGQRYITLIFDNLDQTVRPEARAVASQLLKAMPAAKFTMAAFKIDGRLRLIQAPSGDRERLKDAIRIATDGKKQDEINSDRMTGAEKELVASDEGNRSAADKRPETLAILSALRDSQRIGLEQHARPALAALLALSRAEAKLPGRKAIVFFTQGLRLNSSFREVMQSLVGAANRAGVSIYAADLNALDTTGDAMVASLVLARAGSAGQSGIAAPAPTGPVGPSLPGGEVTMASETAGRIQTAPADLRQNPLRDLCVQTGGAYIANGENMRETLRRMMADLSTYYQAFYVPPITQYDGSFRSVQVKTARRGVKIQSRGGYFALPNSVPEGMRPFEASLLKVLDSPLPNDLPFRSAMLHAGEMPEGNANELAIEVPLQRVDFQEDVNAKLFSFHLSMVARIRDHSGKMVDSFSEDLARHGALEAKEQYRAETATMQRHFWAEAGEYVLETVVQDRNSGRTGAQRRTFTVGKEGGRPALSDVVLVRRAESLGSDDDSGEFFQFAGARIVPDLTGRIPAQKSAAEFFFLVFAAGDAVKPKLELEISDENGQSLGRGTLALKLAPDATPVPYEVAIRCAFPAGKYQAKAILTQGAEQVERATWFTVEGGEAASLARALPVVKSGATPHTEKQQLAITPLTSALKRPPAETLDALLAGAKLRATEYIGSLPNFTCVEWTDRSVDPSGMGLWRHRDSLAELVRFRDNFEHRVLLKVNNANTKQDRDSLLGTLTHGEFGGMLNAVFNPQAAGEFHWKETDSLTGDPVQVFEYRVALAHSTFSITAANGQIAKVGFHGLVYLDETNRAVRRLTMEADNLPEDFPTRSAAFSLDYDYVAIGDHDFLMPSTGSAKVGTGKRTLVLNEFEFRNYRRYGAESTIRFDQ